MTHTVEDKDLIDALIGQRNTEATNAALAAAVIARLTREVEELKEQLANRGKKPK